MKIASTNPMVKMLNKALKGSEYEGKMRFEYITVSPEVYRTQIDYDLFGAEDYGDYNWNTGKIRAIKVSYPAEYYACPHFLTTKELVQIFDANKSKIKYAEDFPKFVLEAVEI